MAFVYILVITGNDPEAQDPLPIASSAPMPALPQSTLTFSAENAFQAFPYFSAPVLTLADSDFCVLQGAALEEYTPEGMNHSVRELKLTYSLPAAGATLTVSSIWPGDYLTALSRTDLLPSTDQDWTLAGLQAVCMGRDSFLHLHAISGDVFYQVEGAVPADLLRTAVQGAFLQE